MSSSKWTPLLTALLALCLIRLWLMPLGSSFWVDEMVTALMVRHGPDHWSLSLAPQVPASIYYALPRLAERLLGFSEIAYRLPSVLALALALWVIARLAAKLIHPDAAWVTAFACLTLRGFNYQAADARPYALGTLTAAVSLWFLVRWLDSGRWRDAVLFALSAALLWRIHLIYWPFYFIFPLYAGVRLLRRETKVDWRVIAGVFALVGAALIPVAAAASDLYREAAAHVIVRPPAPKELIYALKLGLIAALTAPAAIWGRVFRWPRRQWLSASALSLVLGWWLCQPLALYAFSWITGNSLFVSRYLSVALPGAALAATAAASFFVRERYLKAAAAVLGVGVLVLMGRWSEVRPPHHNSDWRSAARAVGKLANGPDVPVICPSPLVEAQPPAWYPDYPWPSFIYPHLDVYPVSGRLYRFPFKESPEAEAYARRILVEKLIPAGRFVIYGGTGQVSFWRTWFGARNELAGWPQDISHFGDVDVAVFAKAPHEEGRTLARDPALSRVGRIP